MGPLLSPSPLLRLARQRTPPSPSSSPFTVVPPLPVETAAALSSCHLHQRMGPAQYDPTVSLPRAAKTLSSPRRSR
uniref:Uncharacterized protein n=1 Tax=Solanum lycopersicum TaxID=4081 RepID=A0A3Q7IV94_SOLLC